MNNVKNKWHKVPKIFRVISYVIFGAIAAVVMGFLFGFIIQQLWNWLMPELFHLKEITYWQAIGIFLLARLIFGFGGTVGSKETSPGIQRSDSEKKALQEEDTKAYSKWRQWEYYDEWWEQDGKKAFDEYLNNKREDSSMKESCNTSNENCDEDSKQ
jgi:uncharacterized membrane protein YraQ (UPF0718 family)